MGTCRVCEKGYVNGGSRKGYCRICYQQINRYRRQGVDSLEVRLAKLYVLIRCAAIAMVGEDKYEKIRLKS